MASKGEQTRGAILEAAIARFGREGFRATSVADVARDAGVGATVPYAYFPGKEALFLAAVDEDAAGLVAKALVIVNEQLPLEDMRIGLILSLVERPRRPPPRRSDAGRPRADGHRPGAPAARARGAAQGRGRAVAGRAARGPVRSDIDTMVVGQGLVAIVLSLLMSVVQLGRDIAAPYAAEVAAVFVAALEPPRP